jgi:hypothetical protein
MAMRSWHVLFASCVLSIACGSKPSYWLSYEQSGGLGGVPEYRLEIDTLGVCTMVVSFVPRDTLTSEWRAVRQLDHSLYRRIGRMLHHASEWSHHSLEEDKLRPDAPIRVLHVRHGGSQTSITFRGALPHTAIGVLSLLDSIVLAARAEVIRSSGESK